MPSFYTQIYWTNNFAGVYCLLHIITLGYNSKALLVPILWSNGAVRKLMGRTQSLFRALLIKLLYRCESSINTASRNLLHSRSLKRGKCALSHTHTHTGIIEFKMRVLPLSRSTVAHSTSILEKGNKAL